MVARASILRDPHEHPARGNRAIEHHRVLDAFMQVPGELKEKEEREPDEDGEAALAEDARGGEIEEGDRAGEQTVFDKKKARQRGARAALTRAAIRRAAAGAAHSRAQASG
jgi:hypothetical protein